MAERDALKTDSKVLFVLRDAAIFAAATIKDYLMVRVDAPICKSCLQVRQEECSPDLNGFGTFLP